MPPELPSEIGNKIRDDVQSMCREVVEIAEKMDPPVTNGDDRHLDREQAQKNE